MLRASKIPCSPVIQNSAGAMMSGRAAGPARKFFHTSIPRAQQYNYGSESSGSAAGTVVKVVGVTGVILGMPLAYAAYDAKFKATVEGYAPFLKPVLDKISPPSAPATPAKSEPQKPKFDPSAPLSFTPAKPSPPPPEKRSVVLTKEVKPNEEKLSSSSDRDALLKGGNNKGSNSPAQSTKTADVAKPSAAAVTVDRIVQTGADISGKEDRDTVSLKKEIAEANTKIAGLDNKVQTLEKAGREALDKAKGSRLLDLAALLNGRALTPEEEILVEAAVKSTSDRLQKEFDDFVDDLEQEHEWELQMQLRRQISAHAGTVQDALKRQEGELEAKFQARLQRRLDEERQRFNLQVASALGRVKGIEDAMNDRSRAEKLSQKSQYLWHASHAFYDAVKYGNLAAHSLDERMVPLSKYVTLAKVFSDSHPFVLSILRAVPEDALNRGVLSEDALRERFSTVKKTARRVAMINDQENSLFRYLLSYVQSLLIRDIAYDLAKTKELDAASLDTFRLLATAQSCVGQGDLTTAVRLVGSLQGEPRKVAADWLKEARLHLETQQIAKLLLAHASSVGLSNVPVDARK